MRIVSPRSEGRRARFEVGFPRRAVAPAAEGGTVHPDARGLLSSRTTIAVHDRMLALFKPNLAKAVPFSGRRRFKMPSAREQDRVNKAAPSLFSRDLAAGSDRSRGHGPNRSEDA
jgi:hypothetical protein